MNDLEQIEQRIKKEAELKEYTGTDRVILAQEKKAELEIEKANRPPFKATIEIADLDACVDGFRPGQLVVVSGPPKHGKSSFCQTMTKRFIVQGHKALWFSYELGYEELFAKFPSKSLDFYVPNQMQSGNLDWVEQRIIESREKYGTDMVFIDHLDFLRDPHVLRGVSINLSSYVGSIVQKIKSIAVQQNMLIFLMAHIRKNQWTSSDLPSSEELRDSGQIAQLADIVMMIARKRAERGSTEVYEGTGAIVGVIENRHNGITRKVNVEFIGGEFFEKPKYEGTTAQPGEEYWTH